MCSPLRRFGRAKRRGWSLSLVLDNNPDIPYFVSFSRISEIDEVYNGRIAFCAITNRLFARWWCSDSPV
jgi:hypothetical protein